MKRVGKFVRVLLILGMTTSLGFVAWKRKVSQGVWRPIEQAHSIFLNTRGLAAVKPELDYSALSDADLLAASENRLMSAAQLATGEKGKIGIRLGHFVTRDRVGNKVLACDFFRRVRLTFEAEGVADSGERPQMTITTPCEAEADFSRMRPIWIPIEEIWNQKANSGIMNYTDQAQIKFSNIPNEWPGRWILTGLQLDQGDENAEQSRVYVDRQALSKWRKRNGILDFTVRTPASKD